jgi:hypothetical protein
MPKTLFDKPLRKIRGFIEIYAENEDGREEMLTFSGSDIGSIDVLEEMTGSVDELGYGLTCNSCTVKLKNSAVAEMLKNHPDLMRRNRVLKPYIYAEHLNPQKNEVFLGELGEDSFVSAYEPDSEKYCLGEFFAAEWTVAADSQFVTVKAYDRLFALQNLEIVYPMTKIENIEDTEKPPRFVVDGAVNRVNGTIGEVAEKLQGIIRDAGVNITIEFDNPNYARYPINYVLFSSDTAWNMLKELAEYSRCFVYCDRNGVVQFSQDERVNRRSIVEVDASNSFSYNLPEWHKTVVNRVNGSYPVLEEGKFKDNRFEIELEDCETEVDAEGNVTHYLVDLDLKNFYGVVTKGMIKRYLDDRYEPSDVLENFEFTVVEN